MKLTLEIIFENRNELVKYRKQAEELMRSSLKSYANENFKFSIDKEVKQDFLTIKLIRFEEVNGEKCMVVQSKMNF